MWLVHEKNNGNRSSDFLLLQERKYFKNATEGVQNEVIDRLNQAASKGGSGKMELGHSRFIQQIQTNPAYIEEKRVVGCKWLALGEKVEYQKWSAICPERKRIGLQ